MATLTLHSWQSNGTRHPSKVTLYFEKSGSYFNGLGSLAAQPNNTEDWESIIFVIPDSRFDRVTEVWIRLNGLQPTVSDSWAPTRIKLTIEHDDGTTEEVFDHNPWNQVFDSENRVHKVHPVTSQQGIRGPLG